ncbi:YbaB/EbfC family nucleoid-associated protein [Streptosporangium sp. KLBMP 9127]|nr:YbaB/EbfC family nucleoid-associated protein [Streptosporangium sp. KLBMP 9127]
MAGAHERVTPTGDPELDRMLSALGEQTARFEKVGRDLAETRGTGEAAGGQVVVEVCADGSLKDLRIDPRAMRLGSAALAEAILGAARAAQQDVAGRANQLMEPLVGEALWDVPPEQ